MSRFRFTLFEADDVTPFFGTGDGLGGVTVADFSDDPAHPRPHLGVVRDWSATEVDFQAGTSSIGALRIEIVDTPTDPTDQDSGLLTSRLAEVIGRRGLLERFVEGDWLTAFNGPVQGCAMGGSPQGLVKITLNLRDMRERERKVPLFFSNHVLFGADSEQGPAVGYGEIPASQFTPLAAREYTVPAIEPYQSIIAGGISHFQRILELGDSVSGIAPGPLTGFNIPEDLAYPSQDADGVWRYRGFRIRWRPIGGGEDDWITLQNMPVWAYQSAVTMSNVGLSVPGLGNIFPPSTTLYFASDDGYDQIPETGEAFEFQVLAVDITEDTPFWWDQGTFGDLLREIYDGEHTLEPPNIPYDPVAMAAFQAGTPRARVKLVEPVEDMGEWVQEHIYRPLGYAPGLDAQLRVVPVSGALPSNLESIPELTPSSIVPIGDWSHSADNVVNTVEFTYIREHLDPLRMKKESHKEGWWIFGHEVDELVIDPEDERAVWQRLVETPVVRDSIDTDSVLTFGAKKQTYKPLTVRSLGNVDGRPRGGDMQDELGMQLQRSLAEQIIGRFRNGAPRVQADFIASDPVVQGLVLGSWVLLAVPWLPEYATGRRGMRHYMQVVAIMDSEPHVRRVTLIDSGVPDPETASGGTGEDCLTGGTLVPGSEGRAVRLFRTPGRHYVQNTCDHPVTVRAVSSAGGGGGGQPGDGAGGGGGGGGALGGDGLLDIVIPALSTVAIDVGAGGAVDGDGGDTIIWIHNVTGAVLDPDVDDPDDAYRAVGGGAGGGSGGAGGSGGSGGGAGAELPISGGSTHTGGSGTTGQGSSGGDGHDSGGNATCRQAAGGGGGSFGGAGSAGVSVGSSGASVAGEGGPATSVPGFSITLGGGGQGGVHEKPGASGAGVCGAEYAEPGAAGASGWGYGGGGGAASGGATAGGPGGVALRYSGPVGTLQPPEIDDPTATDLGEAEICIDETLWPPDVPSGYRARVEYALGDYEPAEDSGDWRLAGYLDAPGCVLTPPVPIGAVVWGRAIAEATNYLPSGPGGTTTAETPGTPGFLAVQLTIAEDGTATLSWTPNTFNGAHKIRGVIHADGDSTTRPLALIDGTVVPGDSPYTLPGVVGERDFFTVDIEAWEDNTYAVQGQIVRRSVQNPQRTIVRRTDGIGSLADVVLTNPQDGDVLVYEEDSDPAWVNRQPVNAVPLDKWGEPSDNTDLDADASRHGLLPKLSGNTSDFLRGDGSWASPTAGSDWDAAIVASADQDVTNNTTPQNDSELLFAATVGEVYYVDLLLLYAGIDQTVDMKIDFELPTVVGWYKVVGTGTTADAILDPGAVRLSAVTALPAAIAIGTISGQDIATLELRMMITCRATGNVRLKFANNTGGSGQWSRRCAGSILRYKLLSTVGV